MTAYYCITDTQDYEAMERFRSHAMPSALHFGLHARALAQAGLVEQALRVLDQAETAGLEDANIDAIHELISQERPKERSPD
jgi:hypothetical protein